jgi:hypothetical protein
MEGRPTHEKEQREKRRSRSPLYNPRSGKESRYRASSPKFFGRTKTRKDPERNQPPQNDTGRALPDLFVKYTTSDKGRF